MGSRTGSGTAALLAGRFRAVGIRVMANSYNVLPVSGSPFGSPSLRRACLAVFRLFRWVAFPVQVRGRMELLRQAVVMLHSPPVG